MDNIKQAFRIIDYHDVACRDFLPITRAELMQVRVGDKVRIIVDHPWGVTEAVDLILECEGAPQSQRDPGDEYEDE
jgi:hypothetical protein